jgi:hypothetical protein
MSKSAHLNDNSKFSSATLYNLIAGATSGIVADLATHPLSTIKTRIQCQGAMKSVATESISNANATEVLYKGTLSGLRSIIKTEGFLSLYRGVGIVVAAAAPGQALYFAGYEAFRAIR